MIYPELFALIRIHISLSLSLCESRAFQDRHDRLAETGATSYNGTSENFRPQNRTAYSSGNTISPLRVHVTAAARRFYALTAGTAAQRDAAGTSRAIFFPPSSFPFPLFAEGADSDIPALRILSARTFRRGNGRGTAPLLNRRERERERKRRGRALICR